MFEQTDCGLTQHNGELLIYLVFIRSIEFVYITKTAFIMYKMNNVHVYLKKKLKYKYTFLDLGVIVNDIKYFMRQIVFGWFLHLAVFLHQRTDCLLF